MQWTPLKLVRTETPLLGMDAHRHASWRLDINVLEFLHKVVSHSVEMENWTETRSATIRTPRAEMDVPQRVRSSQGSPA